MESLTGDQLIGLLKSLPAAASTPEVPIRASLIGLIRFRAPESAGTGPDVPAGPR
jgi:hypothetical protein